MTNSFKYPRASRLVPLLAAVAMLASCVDDPEPVSPVSETGRVAGLLFFDRDNNNVYTPTAGDSVMPGVTVRLLERGTSTVLASTTTGADGRYSIDAPVGTHDLDVVRSSQIIANQFIWCGARPSVYRNEETFVATPLKFGCVVRINAAKQNPIGTTVTIAGIVTAQPGRYRTQNDNLYLQDLTGGIQLFGVSPALGLLEGDSIEVTGELGAFRTQFQLLSPRVAPNIRRGAEVPAPVQLTTAQLVGITNQLSPNVGRLAQVRKVTVGAFPGVNVPGNAVINDGSGAGVMRLDGAAATTIGTTRFAAGACYDITGIVGFFDNATQLQPRGPFDVTEVPCS